MILAGSSQTRKHRALVQHTVLANVPTKERSNFTYKPSIPITSCRLSSKDEVGNEA
jgi:hypothetical protein